MKNNYPLSCVLILLFSFSFSGCELDIDIKPSSPFTTTLNRHVRIHGSIEDRTTQTLLNGASVRLYKKKTSTGIYGLPWYPEFLENGYPKANSADYITLVYSYNGKFEIQGDYGPNVQDYFLLFRNPGYFESMIYLSDTTAVSATIQAKSYVALHVKNTHPYDATDSVSFSIYPLSFAYSQDFSTIPIEAPRYYCFPGMNVDTTIVFSVIGNSNNNRFDYRYSHQQHCESQSQALSFQVAVGDTLPFEFSY